MFNLLLIPFAVVAYLVGCINNAILLSKIKKVDIRAMGSGNPGTLNMSRNLGLKMGLLTFLLDMIKGASVPLISYFVFKDKYFAGTEFLVSDFSMIMCGFCIILGHIYPVFLKFKGGKGIASTIGLCFLLGATHKLFILAIVISIICAVIFIYKTEIGAIGSFIAITPPLIAEIVRLFVNYTYSWCLLVSTLFIILILFNTAFAHRKNFVRIIQGIENPTSIKGMIKKKKEKNEN